MPQMAPISWLILFFLFCFTFILFNIMNYFCFFKSLNSDNSLKDNKNNSEYINMNWKW